MSGNGDSFPSTRSDSFKTKIIGPYERTIPFFYYVKISAFFNI